LIEIKNLIKKYHNGEDEVLAVNNVTIAIDKGEIFGIIGPSGAGKSTLIRMINLLEKPASGHIIIDGEDITGLNSKELRKKREKIGMIFQHFNLLQSRTVKGNISFPLEIANLPKKEREKRVDRLIELVGLTDRANYYPSQLSGGQKQRVGIARALANEPFLLLSDEATSSLDPESTNSILNLLKEIRAELDLTIVLITHEMEVIKEACDQMAVMDKGKIIEEGRVIDVFTRPSHELTKKFIKEVINFNIPEKILKEQADGSLIRISFNGEATYKPLISNLSKKYHLDINILYARIDDFQGMPFGMMVIRLNGEFEQMKTGIKYLQNRGAVVEVIKNENNIVNIVSI